MSYSTRFQDFIPQQTLFKTSRSQVLSVSFFQKFLAISLLTATLKPTRYQLLISTLSFNHVYSCVARGIARAKSVVESAVSVHRVVVYLGNEAGRVFCFISDRVSGGSIFFFYHDSISGAIAAVASRLFGDWAIAGSAYSNAVVGIGASCNGMRFGRGVGIGIWMGGAPFGTSGSRRVGGIKFVHDEV